MRHLLLTVRCERAYEQGVPRLCLELEVEVNMSLSFFLTQWFEDEVHHCRERMLADGSALGG